MQTTQDLKLMELEARIAACAARINLYVKSLKDTNQRSFLERCLEKDCR